MTATISLTGVRTHNLKAIDVEIPRGRLTVIVGVSGSGKSSLAFDTLYAEGQHRYIETFSPWARQFLDRLPRPQVDRIDGLPPAIALRQQIGSGGPRSTVATQTEIDQFVRTLFARFGRMTCPRCGQVVEPVWPESLLQRLRGGASGGHSIPDGTRLQLGFRLDFVAESQDLQESISQLLNAGVTRVAIDGSTKRLSDLANEGGNEFQHGTAIVDRLTWKRDEPERFLESLEQCFALGNGNAVLLVADRGLPETAGEATVLDGQPWQRLVVRNDWNCPDCDWRGEEPTPERLSFRSAVGACPSCEGIGGECAACRGSRLNESALSVHLDGVSLADLQARPIADLTSFLNSVLSACVQQAGQNTRAGKSPVTAVIHQLNRRVELLRDLGLEYLTPGRAIRTLSGGESQRVSLAAVLAAGLVNSLFVLDEPTSGLHASDTHRVIRAVRQLTESGNTVVVVEHDPQFVAAADHVIEIGPGAGSDGGTIVFSGSVSALQADANSRTARWLIDGGFSKSNTPALDHQAVEEPDSETGTNGVLTSTTGGWLTLEGVTCNNIQNADARFPLGCLSAVTGVSGAGKSSLVVQSLFPVMCETLGMTHRIEQPGIVRSLSADLMPDRVLLLDRRQLARSTRSIPATLLGVFDDIRKVFAETHEARKRDFKPGMFSFNSSRGGRCSACGGLGTITVDMQFLSDIEVTCEECEGRRFQNAVLEVRYRDRSIAEVLDMPADEAFQFFHAERGIQKRLMPLRQAGLGYLRIGQPASTLSGGESQRLRIAACLAGIPLPEEGKAAKDLAARPAARSTLFLLDEPTSGLHPDDVEGLLSCLGHLTEVGHTVIVIEHDPQVIAAADYELQMGPGAGADGGRVLNQSDG